MIQQQQLLDIFCDSMQQFTQAIDHLETRETGLKRQTKRMMAWVMTTLLVVLVGISGQIWFFASNMVQVVESINELTQNMGYTQGVLHGISDRIEDMESSVQKVPMISGMMQAFNLKLPMITQEIHAINHNMTGFENSLGQLDISLIGMNSSMQHLTLEVQLIANHTSQFARLAAP